MVVEKGNGHGTVMLEDLTAALGCLVRNAALDACCRQSGVNEKAVIAAIHHILHNDHAVFVAIIVEQLGLDLDVLAQGIESKLFHLENVK